MPFSLLFGLGDLYELAAARGAVCTPPSVGRGRFSVRRSTEPPKEWRTALARAVATPYVLLIVVRLFMPFVVDSDVGRGGVVYPIHVSFEPRAVSISIAVVVRYEQEGVDHLVNQSIHQIAT